MVTDQTDEEYRGIPKEETKDWPDADGNSEDDSTEDPPTTRQALLQSIPDTMLDTSNWVNVPVIPARIPAPFPIKT